jgi:hypothetical protein
MRRFLAASFAAALIACGSSTPTDGVTPPPPPPPSGGAATIAVAAGDGQQSLPGFAVAVNPSVIVKDAAGAPVSGTAVTFTVDSGGGSVTGGTVTTGSDGVATVGGWTLGAAEGRNVLKASVGALPPVRIAATATAAATATFPTMSIGAGGGSIAINQPGPLNGFSLVLPGGAFAASTDWTVSYGSNAGLPAITGVNPITPLLTISGSTGNYAKSPMMLTLPVKVPAGIVPMVVMRDPASGTMEVLVTHRVNDSVVTATTAHLNSAKLMDTVGAASIRRASLRTGYGVQVFVTGLSTLQLAANYDTHFRPGTDDWDFESMGTMQSPDGICAGISATAIWYWFAHRKSQGPLFGTYQRAKGIPESSVTGIRWASLVQSRVDAQDFGPLNDFIFEVRSGGSGDEDMYNTLKANMMITGQPQLIVLAVAGAANAQVSDHSAIAWKTVGSTVYIADASFPGDQTTNVTFNGTRFSSFITPDHLGEAPITYNEINTIGLSQEFDINLLASDWSEVVAKTINEDAFPGYTFHTKYGPARDTIWLEDTLRVWNECGGCTPALTSPLIPEAQGSLLALKPMLYSGATSTWTPQLSDPQAFVPGLNFDWRPHSTNTTGFSTITAVTQTGPDGQLTDPVTGVFSPEYVWLDWRQLSLIKLGVSIAPVAPAQLVATPLDLTASIFTGTPPEHITYQWDFGDNTPKVSKDDDPAVTHTYTSTGTFTAKVVLLDPATKQPEASATTTVAVVAPVIDLTVAGNWPNQTAPANGSYHYTDLHGSRGSNLGAGFDALLIDFDPYTADNIEFSFGISFSVVIPAGSALHAGQTFAKWVSGPPSIGIGQFALGLASDLAHPENGTVPAPGNSGTFTITAVYTLPDGSTAISFSFVVSNGVGGTISGSGMWGYR